MRRFHIQSSDIVGGSVSVIGQNARHIQKVLRMKPGDHIELFDETGVEYDAQIVSFENSKVNVIMVSSSTPLQSSYAQLIVGQSFLKEKKMDELIRPLTELGVSKWIPFFSERSVPKPDGNRLERRLERWKTIVNESMKQCRRSIRLDIETPVSFQDAVQISCVFDLKLFFWEKEIRTLTQIKRLYPSPKSVFILLGPEGGFSESEADIAQNAGFISTGLGPRILRSETAAAAACSILQYLYGDMGNPTPGLV